MDCEARHRDLDYADFAQEFLRRSSLYRDHYARISPHMQEDPGAPLCREMALSWGLVFPGSSGFGCTIAPGVLERSRCRGRDRP